MFMRARSDVTMETKPPESQTQNSSFSTLSQHPAPPPPSYLSITRGGEGGSREGVGEGGGGGCLRAGAEVLWGREGSRTSDQLGVWPRKADLHTAPNQRDTHDVSLGCTKSKQMQQNNFKYLSVLHRHCLRLKKSFWAALWPEGDQLWSCPSHCPGGRVSKSPGP